MNEKIKDNLEYIGWHLIYHLEDCYESNKELLMDTKGINKRIKEMQKVYNETNSKYSIVIHLSQLEVFTHKQLDRIIEMANDIKIINDINY